MTDSDPRIPQAQDEAVFTNEAATRPGMKRLSVISKQYDIDGDGELDEAELAMRNMDKSGRGFITNEKVYGLMQEHMKTQRDVFKWKKIVVGLMAFVVILALSNLGTSLAAAFLAKDTSTNKEDELVNSKSGGALATQSTSAKFEAMTNEEEEINGRGLITVGSGGYVLSGNDGKAAIRLCKRSNAVTVQRTYSDGTEIGRTICHLGDDYISNSYVNNESIEMTNGVSIRENDGGTFTIDGDAFTQDMGEICDVDGDCDTDLVCSSDKTCAECTTSADCVTGDKPFCNSDRGTCTCDPDTEDLTRNGCSGTSNTPFCQVTDGGAACAECLTNTDCASESYCDNTYCNTIGGDGTNSCNDQSTMNGFCREAGEECVTTGTSFSCEVPVPNVVGGV